jgi:hypothetical protein
LKLNFCNLVIGHWFLIITLLFCILKKYTYFSYFSMGVFDFLSKKPAAPATSGSALTVDPTQSTATDDQSNDFSLPPIQSQANVFNDLQYPIPKSLDASNAAASAIPELDSIPGLSSVASSDTLPPLPQIAPDVSVEQSPAPLAPLPTVDTSIPNANITDLGGGIRQVTYADPTNTQPQPVEAAPAPQADALDIMPAAPVPATEVLPVQAVEAQQATPTLPEVVPAPIVDQSTAMPAVPAIPPLDISRDTSYDTVEFESAPAPINDMNAVETSQPVVESAPVSEVPVAVPSQETAPVLPIPEMQVTTPQVGATPVMEVTPIPEPTPIADRPLPETPATIPAVVIDQPKAVETKPEEKPTMETFHDTKLKVLDKVAFIGLNMTGQNPSLSKKTKALSMALSQMGVEFFIDSNKGYGMDVISGASTNNSKVTGVYLKPFYSNYSDEAEIETQLNNYSSIIFSNILDRFKHLLKEAKIFIIPETTGLNNISTAMLFASLQFFYFGQHKPVIFFGLAWKNKFDELKKVFNLSDEEMKTMTFCSTNEEAIEAIKKLDSEFSGMPPVKMKQVVDLRDGDNEKEYLMAS